MEGRNPGSLRAKRSPQGSSGLTGTGQLTAKKNIISADPSFFDGERGSRCEETKTGGVNES